MNKILKLFPVAAAALMLASCNSDDFFGDNNAKRVYNVPTIDVTVEDPAAATRANTTGEAWLIDWQAGDLLRVYDSNVQKYDKFEYDGNLFALANGVGDANVQYVNPYVGATEEENAYALFYGKNSDDGDANAVSYSGWKQGGEAGVPTALVYLPKDLLYAESKLSTDNTESTYKTAMPLWGRVSAPAEGTEAQFSADLKWLTSYVRLRFENANKLIDPIVAVHVKALTWGGGVAANTKTAVKALATDKKKFKAVGDNLLATAGTSYNDLFVDADVSLNGWFEAELKDGGELVNTDDDAVNQPAANRNKIDIDVTGLLEANKNYLWIPVISDQKYDVLAITYELDGGDEYIANLYFDYEAERAKGKAIGVEFPNSNFILDGTSTAKITTGIKNTYDGTTSAVVIFNQANEGVAASQYLTVSEGAASKNTIYLPQISNKDLTVVILSKDNTPGNLTDDDFAHTVIQGADATTNLTIADATGITEQGTGKVKIYIQGFVDPAAAKKVIINSKANIELGGNFSNSTANKEIFVETGEKTTNLTLGTVSYGGDAPFNYGAKTFVATKGNLTVKDMTNTGSVTFNNASGTLAVNAQLTNVNVVNAASATLAAPATKFDIQKNATINIPYDGTPANMTLTTLHIRKGVSAVTLQGGIINEITAENADDDTKVAAATDVTITSSGLSAIKTNSFGATGKISFKSSFAVPAAPAAQSLDAFTAGDAVNPTLIYTGAQLAAVGTTASVGAAGFKLATNITSLTNWQSPALAKPFDGAKAAENGKTIAGVDAPLFGTVSANISNVDLTVAIDKKAADGNEKATVVGGLGKTTATNAVTVLNVDIKGTIKALNNVGGVFGTTGVATTLGEDGVAANAVKVSVDFTNNTVYSGTVGSIATAGTFGKFIGQAGNTAVIINKECTVGTNAFSKSALHFNYNRLSNTETGVHEWQFIGNGDYIGYSPAATSLTYGEKTYTNAWVDPNALDDNKKVKYSSKKVTGTVRIINSSTAIADGVWYTAKDDAFKTKMKASFAALATVADDANWDGLTVEVHNLWEAYAQ